MWDWARRRAHLKVPLGGRLCDCSECHDRSESCTCFCILYWASPCQHLYSSYLLHCTSTSLDQQKISFSSWGLRKRWRTCRKCSTEFMEKFKIFKHKPHVPAIQTEDGRWRNFYCYLFTTMKANMLGYTLSIVLINFLTCYCVRMF